MEIREVVTPKEPTPITTDPLLDPPKGVAFVADKNTFDFFKPQLMWLIFSEML